MAAGTVDLPAVGKVKKEWLYYGGAAVGAVVAFKWYQASQGSGDDEPTFGEGYDEFGNLIGADPGMVAPGSGAGLTDKTPTTEPFGFNNNAEWSQWVVSYLADRGIPSERALAAVGDFLGRQPMNAQEREWIRGAVAAAGPPPQGGPYDIIPEQPGTVPQPNTLPGAILGLRWRFIGPTSLTLEWKAAGNATRYKVTHTILTGTGRGTTGSKETNGTTFNSVGLGRNTQHRFVVQGVNAAGKTGPSATITGTTRRR